MYTSNKAVYFLTPWLTLSVTLFALCFSPEPKASEKITVCTGKAFGNKWHATTNDFIQQAFAGTDLAVEVETTPVKRAETNFKKKKCDAYFLAHRGFSNHIKRKDIFYIPQAIFSASVKFYVSADSQCTSTNECLASFTDKDQIGTFSSLTLSQFLRKQTRAKVVELPAVRQGIQMLNKGRIKAFAFPVVKPEHMPLGLSDLRQLDNLTTTPLYLWLDNKYKPYANHLNLAIQALLSQRDFALLTKKKAA